MVVEHKSKNLNEMTTYISSEPFIIVEEFFPDDFGNWNNPKSNGEITVNTDLIGKVRVWIP
jgi:hypothetical protein